MALARTDGTGRRYGAGWLLLGDHGTPIDAACTPMEQVDAVCSLLGPYGAMQQSLSSDAAQWVTAGVPDRQPHQLPDQLEVFLKASSIGEHLCDGLRARMAVLYWMCAHLTDGPVSASIEHADIHGTNVLVDGGSVRLIDWGDCCVTHPYTSLFVPGRFIVDQLPVDQRRSAWHRMRDAYLEAFGGPTAENLSLLDSATAIAPILRALTVAEEPDGADETRALLAAWVAHDPPAS